MAAGNDHSLVLGVVATAHRPQPWSWPMSTAMAHGQLRPWAMGHGSGHTFCGRRPYRSLAAALAMSTAMIHGRAHGPRAMVTRHGPQAMGLRPWTVGRGPWACAMGHGPRAVAMAMGCALFPLLS